MSCYYWEKNFTPVEKIRWLLDPGPIERSLQLWQVLIQDADPSNRLTVRTPEGTIVLTGRPSRSGAFHLSLMFRAESAPKELSFELERSPRDAAEPLEMSVRQTLYALRARLPVQGEVQHIEVTGVRRRPQLSVATHRQTLRWDVRNPVAPQLLEAVSQPAREHAEEHVQHSGGELGATTTTQTLMQAVAGLLTKTGLPKAIGTPRIFGVFEALYLRTSEGAALYDISVPDEPKELQTLHAPTCYEGTAHGLDLMARYDREQHTIDLYEVAGRHTV